MNEILKFAFKILCSKLHYLLLNFTSLLGAFLKQSRNATISLAMCVLPSVCLFVRMKLQDPNWTDFREISYWAVLIQLSTFSDVG